MREAQTAASDSEELARGEALLRGRDYGGARAALSTLVAALPQGHPHLPRALLGLARAEEGLGRLDEARALYRELARVSPEHRGLALERIRALEAPAKAAPGP
jgi:TolA-binding protein